MIPITGNTYPVKDQLRAMGGRWDSGRKAWMVPPELAEAARALVPPPKENAPAASVGDLGGILAFFDKARKRLKYPAVVLQVPGRDPVRVTVAGAAAREPGSLTICEVSHSCGEKREWLGRVSLNGLWQPGLDAKNVEEIAPALRRLAAEPTTVAAEFGKLTGNCCFCMLPLSDPRSTQVGYGRKCASNYNLPW